MTGNDHYGMDLSQIALAEFKDQLKAGDLLPSQQVLLEDIDARFQTLAGMGLETLQDVVAALKTKPRLTQFAEKSGLAPAYLNILRRKAKSYIPNPVYFRDIPGLDAGHVASLIAAGIKHTRHFFQQGMTPAGRSSIAEQTGMDRAPLEMFAGMTDLARVGYLGPVFIRLLVDAGVRHLDALIHSDVDDLLDRLEKTKAEQGLKTPLPGRSDMLRCMETARRLPRVFEGD